MFRVKNKNKAKYKVTFVKRSGKTFTKYFYYQDAAYNAASAWKNKGGKLANKNGWHIVPLKSLR